MKYLDSDDVFWMKYRERMKELDRTMAEREKSKKLPPEPAKLRAKVRAKGYVKTVRRVA